MNIFATTLVISIMIFGVVWIIVGPEMETEPPIIVDIPEKYTPHEPIIIKNDQNFTDYCFPGNGTEVDPFLIEGYHINSSVDAIQITQTTKHFVIRNCKLEAERRGIYITFVAQKTVKIENNIVASYILIGNSHFVEIQDNSLIKGESSGMGLIGSDHSIIRNNSILGEGFFAMSVYGDYCLIENNSVYSSKIIYLNVGIAFQGTGTIIRNNTIENQYWGLYLTGGNSNLITNNSIKGCLEGVYAQTIFLTNITNNFLFNNTLKGIHFSKCGSNDIYFNHFEKNNLSVEIYESYFNDIANNTFLLNYIGVEIRVGFPGTISYVPSSNNTVKYNLFAHNTLYGVKNSIYSRYSKIYLNSFYSNNIFGTSQAYDNGFFGEWYYFGTLGNYWDDWTVGEYVIDGNSNSTDAYPLSEPPV